MDADRSHFVFKFFGLKKRVPQKLLDLGSPLFLLRDAPCTTHLRKKRCNESKKQEKGGARIAPLAPPFLFSILLINGVFCSRFPVGRPLLVYNQEANPKCIQPLEPVYFTYVKSCNKRWSTAALSPRVAFDLGWKRCFGSPFRISSAANSYTAT